MMYVCHEDNSVRKTLFFISKLLFFFVRNGREKQNVLWRCCFDSQEHLTDRKSVV